MTTEILFIQLTRGVKLMAFYKIIGSGSLILSALIMYHEIQKYEKLKLRQINAFILLIEYIKNQIECFLLPIDVIIQNCNEDLIKCCGINMNYKKAEKLDDLIESTNFYCGDECIELIKQFSSDFGQGYIGEQLRSCDYYRSELIKQRDRIKEKSSKEKKLRLALCLSASFSLILLLI